MAKIKNLLSKYWKQLIVPGLIFLVSIIGITYAYFSIQVTGNDEASSMVVTTASLILNYIDGPEVTLSGAYPGASVEKEVKVQNIGTVGVTYAIGFVNMENTFQNDELLVSYTCKSYENFGEAGEVESGECYPLSPQPIDQSQPGIEEGIFIGVGITQVYQIKIEFLETGSAQDYNQDAHFSGLINIGETLDAFTLVAQVLYENDAPCEGCVVEVNPEESGQGGFLLPENGYTVTRLSSNIIALNTTIKPRSATTDSEGLFVMPKVSQGTHEIVVKDSLGNLVMSGGIEVSVAPEPSVSGTTITGKKGEEIVAILLQAKSATKEIKTLSLLDYPLLTVDMDGGTTSQVFKKRYFAGEQITLVEPTRENYEFDSWIMLGEGSTLVNDVLTIGAGDTLLIANWVASPTLTVNASGGTWSGTTPQTIAISGTTNVPNPTRTNYIFTGWTVTGAGSSISGTTFTMGTENSTLTANWAEASNDYAYTGDYQTYTIPTNGYYKIEAWGGQGGTFNATYTGGKGGYTTGIAYFDQGEIIYIYVGGQGGAGTTPGWNGGGYGGTTMGRSGGGATDIRFFGTTTPTAAQLVWNSTLGLNSRIMVAGGGGSAAGNTSYSVYGSGGAGGNLFGGPGISTAADFRGTGGNQVQGGGYSGNTTPYATFGVGQFSTATTNSYNAAGGGGYYGGGASSSNCYGGGGGSSFISGYAGVNAITSSSSRTATNNTKHYSGKYFIKGDMQSGNNSGNGKAKITFVSTTKPVKTNTNLNNVRYIQTCYTASGYSLFVEIQAIKDGVNVARLGAPYGWNGYLNDWYGTKAIDGLFTTYAGDNSAKCITIKLNVNYDLDSIGFWNGFTTSYPNLANYDTVTYSYTSYSVKVADENLNWVTLASSANKNIGINGEGFSAWD